MRGHIKERSPGRWAIVLDVRDPETGDRKRKWHSFTGTKRQAETECARLIAELDSGGFAEGGKVTFRDFAARWLEHERGSVSPKTLERYEALLLKNVVPVIGAERLERLTPAKIDALWSKLLASGRRDGTGGLSPRTVHHARRVTQAALDQAVVWNLIKSNPVTVTRPPRVERKQMQVYDPGQVGALLAGLRSTRMYIPVVIAISTGARRGEILALRWRHFDLDKGVMTIEEAWEEVGKETRLKPPKSGKPRVVTLPASLCVELKSHRVRQAEEQLRLGVRVTSDSFVVAQVDGSPIKPTSLTHEWVRVTGKIEGLPRMGFHGLRHSHASMLLSQGVQVRAVTERLGHSVASTTMNIYAHLMPGAQESAAAAVDSLISNAIRKTPDQIG